jgi:hypothetical protein
MQLSTNLRVSNPTAHCISSFAVEKHDDRAFAETSLPESMPSFYGRTRCEKYQRVNGRGKDGSMREYCGATMPFRICKVKGSYYPAATVRGSRTTWSPSQTGNKMSVVYVTEQQSYVLEIQIPFILEKVLLLLLQSALTAA